MTKFYAKVTAMGKGFSRYIAVDPERRRMDAGLVFKTTGERAQAHQFSTEEEAEFAARALLKDRYGKPFSGGIDKFVIEPVRRMDAFMDFHKKLGDEIVQESAAQFMETSKGAGPAGSASPDTCPSFDWEDAGEDLYASLAAVIDQIDYTNQACSPFEMIGTLLDPVLIEQAKERLSKWMDLRLKAKSQNGDGVGG
jgi:hypothetical protein